MMHIPVLRDEVEKYLAVQKEDLVVDGTLGLGGHAGDALGKLKGGRLYGFDQDERNLRVAEENLKEIGANFTLFHDNFCHLTTRLTGEGVEKVDAILLDLGLSSPHLDDAERGFSFRSEGPLDMRFDQRDPLTAADILNTYEEERLAQIFFLYGELREGRKLARRIVERRKEQLFAGTVDFAAFVERVLGGPKRGGNLLAQVFQALRIEVNGELQVLEDVLRQVAVILRLGGRVVIISYHSLEDRMVKQFFKELLQPKAVGDQALYSNVGDPYFEALTKKPVGPSDEELATNPRSRSAKLRAYKKIKELDFTF